MGLRNATHFYPNFPDEMTELGKFIFYRTYSRYLPEKRRRETWKEVCLRAISYNTSLAETSEEEKLKLFDNMFNTMRALPFMLGNMSGEKLQNGSTKIGIQ